MRGVARGCLYGKDKKSDIDYKGSSSSISPLKAVYDKKVRLAEIVGTKSKCGDAQRR